MKIQLSLPEMSAVMRMVSVLEKLYKFKPQIKMHWATRICYFRPINCLLGFCVIN